MFRDTLQKLVDRIDGAVAGVLMGFDGISVESYTKPSAPGDPIDVQTVGMELAHVITQARRAADLLDLGGLTEITFRAKRLHVVVQALDEEYFLAVAIRPDGNVGKARFCMRTTAPRIQADL